MLPQIKGFTSCREANAVFFCSWRQGGAGACRTGPGDGDISTQRLMGCPSLPWACWLFVGVLGSEPGRPLLLRAVGSFNPLRPRVFSNPLFPSPGGVAPSLAARSSRRPTNRRPDLRITWSARGRGGSATRGSCVLFRWRHRGLFWRTGHLFRLKAHLSCPKAVL